MQKRNAWSSLYRSFTGLSKAVVRFPATSIFLLATAVYFSISISQNGDYAKQLLTCAVGAVLCAALQTFCERFVGGRTLRIVFMVIGILLTLGYYLLIRHVPIIGPEIGIRTSAVLVALFIAFIWMPVIKSRVTFNESFMAFFKALFQALFYAAVIYGGCALILSAINLLIVRLDSDAYLYTANIVFVLFAPLFFLSLIPVYPGGTDAAGTYGTGRETVEHAVSCPRFLETLISYIVIPLAAAFTVILLLYILINIRGKFWTNNLLEPMLISYAITIILVYILASRMENRFAAVYRSIFPKVLIPIVLFQIAASVLKLTDSGITHSRYYVILFGLFAASAGVVMSLVPVRKNGIIAAMLIAFSVFSVIPPVDAFTVSRISQKNLLETTLLRNRMLSENTIKPNASISDSDKKKIASSAGYLDRMGYTGQIAWLPSGFTYYRDFDRTFGFNEYETPGDKNNTISVTSKLGDAIVIGGYDFLVDASVNKDENGAEKVCNVEKDGKVYTLSKVVTNGHHNIVLEGPDRGELIRFDTSEIFDRFRSYTNESTVLSDEDAAFLIENTKAVMKVIVKSANLNSSGDQAFYYADLHILLRIK